MFYHSDLTSINTNILKSTVPGISISLEIRKTRLSCIDSTQNAIRKGENQTGSRVKKTKSSSGFNRFESNLAKLIVIR